MQLSRHLAAKLDRRAF